MVYPAYYLNLVRDDERFARGAEEAPIPRIPRISAYGHRGDSASPTRRDAPLGRRVGVARYVYSTHLGMYVDMVRGSGREVRPLNDGRRQPTRKWRIEPARGAITHSIKRAAASRSCYIPNSRATPAGGMRCREQGPGARHLALVGGEGPAAPLRSRYFTTVGPNWRVARICLPRW